MSQTETVQFQATGDFKRQLEAEAERLHLSLSAYVLYLHSRIGPDSDAARVDRHVNEVFGKNGELMRRLAR